MTNEQILKKAIKKAVKNGWDEESWPLCDATFEIDCCLGIFEMIFNHSFAKAFFGEKDFWKETKCTCNEVPDFHVFGHDAHQLSCARTEADRGYKFHLQQMVLEKEPLKYLKKFL